MRGAFRPESFAEGEILSSACASPSTPNDGGGRIVGRAFLVRRSHQRALRILLLALTCLLGCTGYVRPAAAAGVPMCGDSGISVEAPPPIYPTDEAVLEACGERMKTFEGGVPVPKPLAGLVNPGPLDPGLLPPPVVVLSARGVLVPFATFEAPKTDEHSNRAKRPPRAAR